jgi:hypothetical protein|tara:strand:- start:873 stop:1181 length:309 start_codon:yes stop_codon:yes gene_type:complete
LLGSRTIDESHKDAIALGVKNFPEPEPEESFEVYEENWESVLLFSKVMTQWRTTMGGVIGLDYAVCEWVFRMYEVKDPKSVFEDFQLMERTALDILNKDAKE